MSEYDEDPESAYSGATPPHDRVAERAVLGSILSNAESLSEVGEVIRAEDFYLPAHEWIFDACMDLTGTGTPVDLVTVHEELRKRGLLAKVGGGGYLHGLVEDTYHLVGQAPHYATIVRDKAVLRRLATSATRIHQWAMEADGSEADEIVDRAQIEMLSAVPSRSEDYAVVGDGLAATMDEIEASASNDGGTKIATGFYDLDDLLGGGFLPGQMVVVAGRPAMGKSTLAVDFARACSIRRNLTSCIFSLEMTRSELTMRLLSAEGKVPLAKIRNGDVSDDDWRRIAVASHALSTAPLFIDDSPHLTMTEIRAKARRLRQRHDLRLIVIDYLQLMSSGKKVESRQNEVSEFSRQIKLLAKELEVPVIALSQLNRGPEQRTSKRPLMSDLRESGSIEQDADIVILMHREDAYEVESSRPGEADLIVAKHRNGPTRDIAVAAQLHYSRFADLANG
jgi:replicative DNA helicase